MRRAARSRGAVLLLGVALAVVLPKVIYPVLALDIVLWGLFAVAVDLLLGYAGLLSFGHAAYWGLGGYSAGVLARSSGLSYPLAALGGGLLVAVIAIPIGFLAIRRRGIYFAMVTLAFAQMVYYVVNEWRDLTGGENGLQSIPRTLAGTPISDPTTFYYAALPIALCGFWLAHRVVHSPFGHVLVAIRDNEPRAQALGYATWRYKLQAFVLSAALSGLAGGLSSLAHGFASLDLVDWRTSGEVVIMVVLGGIGTQWGGVVGAAVVLLLRDVLANWTDAWGVLTGAIFVVVVMGFRRGLWGTFVTWRSQREARRLPRLAALFLLVVGLAGCQVGTSNAPATAPAATSAATKDKLVVGYVALNATQLPSWVAKDRGIFDKNGLDVELQYIQGGSSPTAGLLAGQLQVLIAAEQAIQASLQGGELIYIAAPTSTIFFALYTTPDITDAATLKGKKIGITQVGSATHTAAKMALKNLNLDPDRDVTLLNSGSAANILAALQNGALDGGVLSSPTNILARKAGLRELVNVAKLDDPFPSGWAATSKSYLADHRDAMRRYVQSIAEAVAFEIRSPAETQAILAKYVDIDDPTIAREAYDEVVPYLKKNPTPDPKAVKNALDELSAANPAASGADAAKFVDQSLTQELQTSGFIDGLYK